jgi:acetoin utilization protein AcuB
MSSASDLTTKTVGELMTRRIVSVSMDDSLNQIRGAFEMNGFHHLLVVENEKLVGVISDRDLLHNLSPFVGSLFSERPQDRNTLNRKAHQVMSRKLVTVTPETSLGEAAALLLEHHISCLPVVVEQMRPVGIVTWRDLLRELAPPPPPAPAPLRLPIDGGSSAPFTSR